MLEKYRQGDSRVYRKSRKRAAESKSFGYVQLGQHHAARAVGYEPHKPGNKRLEISRARKHVVQPLLSRIEQKQSEKHVDNQNKSKYFKRMHHRMKDVILPEIVPFFYVMMTTAYVVAFFFRLFVVDVFLIFGRIGNCCSFFERLFSAADEVGAVTDCHRGCEFRQQKRPQLAPSCGICQQNRDCLVARADVNGKKRKTLLNQQQPHCSYL